MKTKDEILVNQFAQGIVSASVVIEKFDKSDTAEKRTLLLGVEMMMSQSKPMGEDIDNAVKESGIKLTSTACVMIRKGLNRNNLKRMYDLNDTELRKFFTLMLFIFRIAYNRRFNAERDTRIDKWWYWDLTNDSNIKKILWMYPD